MEKELSKYFLPEHQFFLENISYSRIDKVPGRENIVIKANDSFSVHIEGEDVTLHLTRTVCFDPESIFRLSIGFGADLKLDPVANKGIKWDEEELASRFQKEGEFVTMNLMNRIQMLTAEITSSFGQQPLILPGLPMQK